jgi:hypothetical protein
MEQMGGFVVSQPPGAHYFPSDKTEGLTRVGGAG